MRSDYRRLIGGDARILVQNALHRSTGRPPSPSDVTECLRLKTSFESARAHVAPPAFTGARAFLSSLGADGLLLAILSNKREAVVQRSVAECFPDVAWAAVRGARDGTPAKPSPVAALRIVDAHMPGISADECAFVGDTDVDMRTGVAAGMVPIGVAWGYQAEGRLVESGARAIARERREVADIVRGLDGRGG